MSSEPTTKQETAGRRATAAQQAFLVGGNKVAGKITHQSMKQSFPDLEREHDEFLATLANQTSQLLRTSFHESWSVLVGPESKYKDFIEKCNKLEEIQADAQSRRESGQSEPKDGWIQMSDPSTRVASHVTPILKNELEFLRERKKQLSQLVSESAQTALSRQAEMKELEQQVMGVFESLEKTQTQLANVDNDSSMNKLHNDLVSRLQDDQV